MDPVKRGRGRPRKKSGRARKDAAPERVHFDPVVVRKQRSMTLRRRPNTRIFAAEASGGVHVEVEEEEEEEVELPPFTYEQPLSEYRFPRHIPDLEQINNEGYSLLSRYWEGIPDPTREKEKKD